VTGIRSVSVQRSGLLDLHRGFPELRLDCGNQDNPGITDVEEWRDWSFRETTPDQLRIEDYLDHFDLSGRSILHIGIGNSSLASRFSHRARSIDGTSILVREIEHGAALDLPNYRVALHNKYSVADDGPNGRFDFIVDNNPTSYCCCLKHFEAMMKFYASRLTETGQIVTDRVGLGWRPKIPGADPRWAFNFNDLAIAAKLAGLSAHRMDDNVFVVAGGDPERPWGYSGVSTFLLRSARSARRIVQ
jgi:hypothetical protein